MFSFKLDKISVFMNLINQVYQIFVNKIHKIYSHALYTNIKEIYTSEI